ncbi:hypothetical protein WJX73_002794 [Symbiochloris irregularis]|uniref:Uncharacterized protein n=1 Tax=Symbiochloris irregularis TaxID=706552 RepID=A0AAW1NJA2_9CHLO
MSGASLSPRLLDTRELQQIFSWQVPPLLSQSVHVPIRPGAPHHPNSPPTNANLKAADVIPPHPGHFPTGQPPPYPFPPPFLLAFVRPSLSPTCCSLNSFRPAPSL